MDARIERQLGTMWEISERTVAGLQQEIAARDERITALEAIARGAGEVTMSQFSQRHSEVRAALGALDRLDDEGDQAAELRAGRLATVRGLLERLLDDNAATAPAEPMTSTETAPEQPITLGSRKARA